MKKVERQEIWKSEMPVAIQLELRECKITM